MVGDLGRNCDRIVEWIGRAREAEADLIVFPELALTGYPPEDLLLKPSFIRDNLRYLDRVAAATEDIAAVVGFVDHDLDIYNAAAFVEGGQVRGVYHKFYLPNYGVFDEERYFRRGRRCPIFELAGVRIGVSICEDAWYATGPISVQAQQGVELLVNINGSPYHSGKRAARETMIATRAMDSRAFLAWVNHVGGQDELVFDGNSLVFGPEGQVIAHARHHRHVGAAAARRDRLVRALAAEPDIETAAEDGLARLRQSIRERRQVDVAAPDDGDARGL